MPLSKIVSKDISSWGSLDDIADTLKKRGLERLDTEDSPDNEIIMELSDEEFLAIVKTEDGKTESDYRKRMNSARHTQLVSTNDFREFTFVTRVRSWDEHGRIKYQKFSFEKSQFEGKGERRTTLEKLNDIEYGKSETVYQLYDTKRVVKKFYDQFEEIRAKMVQEVSGIPDDRGEAKQNYAQTIFNRLIFLYFIQEKNLLDYNKQYLREKHDDIVSDGKDVYEEFYKPLFFDKLAKKTSYDMKFGSLPYLNGGLFTRSEIEEEFPDVRLGDTAEKTNKLYGEILDFLGDWNWYADERLDIIEPNNLSPEVLGHIFEKTVNQKEMGAYYTPEEITHFMARNTIHPYILDRMNEEFGKEYENIDEVFKIEEDSEDEKDIQIGSIDDIERDEIEHLYFEVLKNIKVLDPAVGSGAFLLAAQDILLDVYLSCIEYFRRLDEEEPWEMTGRITDLLEKLEEEDEESNQRNTYKFVKREIILNNLYGVDIDKGATEICKLRLWLSMVADMEEGDNIEEVDALPNIDFNIRQGNSLIGYTEPIQKALFDTVDNDQTATSLSHFNENSIADRYEKIIEAIEEHKNATSGEEAKRWKNIADERLEEYREEPDESIHNEFKANVDEDITMDEIKDYSPFHWVLEFARVYSEGGFDVIIGNPPWDKIKAERDDFFPRYDEVFRQRMPSEKDKKEEELKSDPEIKEKWDKYKEKIDRKATYYNEGSRFELQAPVIDGRVTRNENDLSALFLERTFTLADDDSYIAQILPGAIFQGGSRKDLRMHMLDKATLNNLVEFENHGVFEALHYQYKFGIVVLKNSGETTELKGKFERGNLEILRNFDENYISVPKEVLSRYTPEPMSFPYIKSEKQISVLEKIVTKPAVIEKINDDWYLEPYSELHRTKDTDRFIEDESSGDYPVYGGSNVYQFIYTSEFLDDLEEPKFWSVEGKNFPEKSAKRRIKEKNLRLLKRKIFEQFDGKGSQKSFVNELLNKHRDKELDVNDVLLDCNEYRIVYRHVTNSTNERTLIASVIPKNIVCHNALTTIRPFNIKPNIDNLKEENLHGVYQRRFTDQELFVALGLLNSIPLDYLMRSKVEENIVMYKFKESQVPRLTDGDDWFNYIWIRAAKLNCYGEKFEEMRERLGGIEAETDMEKRKELQAEIDAAAFHAYGLERDETKYVLDNFHRVENPRMMTRDYFDMVLEKYDELAEKGPME